jgi:6-phosphogluconolactonase
MSPETTQVEVFDDHDKLAEAAADLIAGALLEGVMIRGWASLAGAGGSTPAPLYRLLAHRDLPWAKVGVTLTDERFVDPVSPQSNQRLFSETLLAGFARKAAFMPLMNPAPSPAEAAEAVDKDVRALLPFDVVLLGMGEDGHFASLFPHSPALALGLDAEADAVVIPIPAALPAPPQSRLSLTLAALLQSKLIVVLITGEAKRAVLERAQSDSALPISAVLNQGRVPVRILWAA